MSLRVVFDTSTLVSAALRVGSIPYQSLLKALATCDLCACVETLTELEQVMGREKFDRYLDRPLREEFVALIRRNSHLFSIEDIDLTSLEPSCRDLKDNKFLALALATETELLVSSDEDLLVLNPWHQIRIVTPGEFLAQSKASPEAEETT
jgi:putative PIN family toxin of toxin-antitoxin system